MYVNGHMLTKPTMDRVSPGPLGVRVCKREKCFEGYTLFSSAFGYTEYLVDLNGMVVHTWPVVKSQLAEMRPNGNLLVDRYEQGRTGLDELTPDGACVWHWDGPYHHDFEVLENGNIVCLTSVQEPCREGFYLPEVAPAHLRTDVVVEIDRNGNVVWEFSFAEHIGEICALTGLPLPLPHAQEKADGTIEPVGKADWAHTNTIEVLPDTSLGQKDARFRAGNLLFCFRSLDIIGIIDREKNEVVWTWGLGVIDGPHQPTMLENGNILLYDNGTYRETSIAREIDPVSCETVWQYEDGANFYSPYRSGVQRLPNGNTLICESDAGRIFEVTMDKEIVWDYYSPFLGQGPQNQGRHVYRATRLTEDELAPLFDAREGDQAGIGDQDRNRLTSFRDVLKYYEDGFRFSTDD